MTFDAITRYQAEDGSVFTTEDAAYRYVTTASQIARLLDSLPARPDTGTDFENGGGYIQHTRESLRPVWNGLLELANVLFPHQWFDQSKDFGADASWAARLIGDLDNKQLQHAWWRMSCVDRNTFREYGQPYFALHPAQVEGGQINQ